MATFDASLRPLPALGSEPVRAARSPGDAALIRAAQRGNAEAWSELFACHWPRAFRAAYLIVHDAGAAEDIAQEAFLAALGALDRFDRRRPFGPWLHRIVVNRAIDDTRAPARRREVGTDAVPDAGSEWTASHDDTLLEAIGTLAADHRAVIVLRYLLEFTPGEIADTLALPRGTVNSRLRRALDHLGDHLGDDDR